jgi:hypothetical protein
MRLPSIRLDLFLGKPPGLVEEVRNEWVSGRGSVGRWLVFFYPVEYSPRVRFKYSVGGFLKNWEEIGEGVALRTQPLG